MSKKDNYHIISIIGQGAFGKVYKGRIKGTSQIVALKVISKKNKSAKEINNNKQQIDILKKLKHENVILHIDSFQTSSQFVLVTQLGHGQLYSVIQDDKSLDQQQVIIYKQIRKIAIQITRALYYIHTNRITHRDLKPQNLLISSNGIIKLCDFGFARSMSFNSQVLTSLKGTPLYMAPELLQQKPYNHTADLWSLGVILYELYCGNPPFLSQHIFSLIDHIVKDPIRYPQSMGKQFKSFLNGLLMKNAKERMDWPNLLHHPFIRQTEIQEIERVIREQKYNLWAESLKNHPNLNQNIFKLYNFSNQKQNFNKNSCLDQIWNSYKSILTQNQLAIPLKVIQSSTNLNHLNCQTQIKKICVSMWTQGKEPQPSIDIARNANLPNLLLSMLKNILKIDYGKQFTDLITDILKAQALIAKINFDPKIGIEMVYIRTFLPQLPNIHKSIMNGETVQHANLAITLIKNIGILVNNASKNYVRSFNFYKDLIQVSFIQDSSKYLKHFQENIIVNKYIIQLFSALVHPLNGSISTFPWKRSISPNVAQFNDCYTMFQVVKQKILNSLMQIDWSSNFVKLFTDKEQSCNLSKISILRILLQLIRISKEFAQRIVIQKQMLRILLLTIKIQQPIIFSTNLIILTILLKTIKNKQQIEKQIFSNLKFLEQKFIKCYKKNPICSLAIIFLFQQLIFTQQASIVINRFYEKYAHQQIHCPN